MKRLEQIKEKLARWQNELPKLIQPEREHIQNIADIALLLEVVEVYRGALERIASEKGLDGFSGVKAGLAREALSRAEKLGEE